VKRLAFSVAMAMALVLGSAGPAEAGTYTIHQCNYPGFAQKPTSNWAVSASFANPGQRDDCTAGGSFAADHNQGSNAMPENSSIQTSMAIPSDRPALTINSLNVHYSAAAASGSPDFLSAGSGATNNLYYQVNGGASNALWSWSNLPAGARSAYLGIYCGGGPLGPCNFGAYQNTVRIHGAEFVIEEGVSPQQPGIDGGSLLSSGPRGGTETLAYHATDPDSGIARVDAKLGGTRIGGDDFAVQPARCPYVDWNACARDTGNQSVAVDTRAVADGTHNLTMTATDAAGNARSVSGGQVTVDNVPEAPPGAGSGGAGDPSGTNGQPGAVNGTNGGPGSKLSAADRRGRRKLRVKADQPARIRGRLLSKHDKPVSGARLSVLQQEIGSAENKELGQVRTDENGKFTYVAPAGHSRKILFGYHAHAGDTTFTSTSHVQVASIAVVKLRLSAISTRPGRPLRLKGRIIGRPFPRQGVLVVLQGRARGSRHWRTFATTRTRRRGSFAAVYRFRTRGRFELRALTKVDSGWRYSPGVSGPRRVGVR